MSKHPQGYNSSFFLFSSPYMHLTRYIQQCFYIAPRSSNVSIFFLVQYLKKKKKIKNYIVLTRFSREQKQLFLFQVDLDFLGYLPTWKCCPTHPGILGRWVVLEDAKTWSSDVVVMFNITTELPVLRSTQTPR